VKGVAVVFDTDFEEGYRSEMDIMLIATWDGTKGEVFTDIDMSEKVVGCEVWDINNEAWKTDTELLVGHNLHGEFKDHCFDLLDEVKLVSADYLENEGKRFTLYDLARWNRCRSLPVELVSKVRRKMAWTKGQHIKVARWALEDARLCFDLFHRVRKQKRVRFLDIRTGKKPFVDVSWDDESEEE